MKTKIRLLVIAITFFNSINAQQSARNNISVGIGFPNLVSTFLNIYANEQDYKVKGMGPYHLKYEYRAGSHIGIGLNINYASTRVDYIKDFVNDNGVTIHNHIRIKNSSTALNFRTNLHILNASTSPRTDLYFGLGIGYKFGGIKITADDINGAPSLRLPSLWHLGFETTFGYRYFFTDNIGIYAELGFAKSIAQVGVTGRF